MLYTYDLLKALEFMKNFCEKKGYEDLKKHYLKTEKLFKCCFLPLDLKKKTFSPVDFACRKRLLHCDRNPFSILIFH